MSPPKTKLSTYCFLPDSKSAFCHSKVNRVFFWKSTDDSRIKSNQDLTRDSIWQTLKVSFVRARVISYSLKPTSGQWIITQRFIANLNTGTWSLVLKYSLNVWIKILGSHFEEMAYWLIGADHQTWLRNQTSSSCGLNKTELKPSRLVMWS